jgi:hypothetical protein
LPFSFSYAQVNTPCQRRKQKHTPYNSGVKTYAFSKTAPYSPTRPGWRPFAGQMPSDYSWTTKKNGQRGATMHHTALLVPFCPVQALANRVHHLFQIVHANPELSISFVGLGSHVTSKNITLTVRESVVLSGLLNSGYSPSRVSAHSLRASGAMALRLNDVGEYFIKKLG